MSRKTLLERFIATGVSWRIAAQEMGMSRTVLHEYLHGKRDANKKNPEPIILTWLESRERMAPKIVKTKPTLRQLTGLTIADAAKALGTETSVLYHALAQGDWPSQKLLDDFEKYVAAQKAKGEKKMLTKIALSEEHLAHYGMKRDPFTHEMESEEDIIELKALREAERKMLVAIDKSGWCAITGDVGSGKTTLIKKVKTRLAKRKDVVIVEPRTLEKQYLGAGHLCLSILRDLGTDSVSSKYDLESKARLVAESLVESCRDGRKVVILIDEAHLLRNDALLALKRLYEFEVGFRKTLSIVLVGQSPLARRLKSDFSLKEVSQRVDLYEIDGLNGQVGAYIAQKLERAGLNGASAEVFEKAAVKAFMERNADTPLAVNNLAAAALIAAWDLGERKVSAEIVRSIPGTF